MCGNFITAQTNSININALLNDNKKELKIEQKIVFHNSSDTILNRIFLHNWANSFSNNETPLAKRFIEDYRSDFYFSKQKNKGFSKINQITVNDSFTTYKIVKNHPDIIEIKLSQPLNPNDHITISAVYTVKVPSASFTGFGKTKTGYHLRYWYLTPAVYKNEWQLMSNLNMDDLYANIADFTIQINTPKKYYLESNLYKYVTEENNTKHFYLLGKKQKDIIIDLDTLKKYKSFKTKNIEIKTDFFDTKIDYQKTTEIIKKEVDFIQDYLGRYPYKQLFIDRNSVEKNLLHNIYSLPKWLKPFPENFRWEMSFFKAMLIKYIDDALLVNKRTDYWLNDGILTFLMIEYVNKYYPDLTILGKYSNYWPIKGYTIAKLKQNDKYPFVYLFSSRNFYDQSLTTPADSLSNFNRKIVSKYKAGLGFKYLQDYIGEDALKKTFKSFYYKNKLKLTDSKQFLNTLNKNTDKNLTWFKTNYIDTNKKLDYKITKITRNKDSIEVTIKNKKKTIAPIGLYGVKDKKIKFKKWIDRIDSTKTIKIPRGDFDRVAINYERLYPEYNLLNNYKKIDNKLINKPLQLRLYKDIQDPYYSQVFYKPVVGYNLYDGIILGVNFNNQPILARNFKYSITPNYSFKSKQVTGSYLFTYNQYINSNIYKIDYSIGGNYYHYAPNLGYTSFIPSVTIEFNRKSLRDLDKKYLTSRLVFINKEVNDSVTATDHDKYNILNFRYTYSNPGVIRGLKYAINTEFGNSFTKFSTDIRYLKRITPNKRFSIRLFGGFFINNKSKSNYFSFGLNRGSDYLFEQNLFGRSENSGLFSQQYVIADGGFKSNFKNSFANETILSVNTSIGIWKWVEFYNDGAMLKNHNENPHFFYENGIRLNFIPQAFEFYLPIYTNNGFEFNNNYFSKIKFIITTDVGRIYNYIRRGLF